MEEPYERNVDNGKYSFYNVIGVHILCLSALVVIIVTTFSPPSLYTFVAAPTVHADTQSWFGR